MLSSRAIIGKFFNFRLESVNSKKYTNANGKGSKYAVALNIGVIWSCGGGVGDAGTFIVSSAGSFLTRIGIISATIFYIV